MKRVLPSPQLPLGMFDWLLGVLVAVLLPLLMAPLRPRPNPLRR